MASVALSSITRCIQKHQQRRIELYVQRNKALRERKTVDVDLAQRRKREDYAFTVKIARKLRDMQAQLERGFTNGNPFLVASQAIAVAQAPRARK
ncbi:hypothetical protein ACJ73_08306 [Blastomyces percursus]|uniref:Uncharacterized protein n=1 Tax=Blastomyces percursus TaxID=1658174 RepID=A0A1J9PVE8_9EURO|nr:hypothetical protein ACJ73_08306 [Blastomyces percursus]